MANPVILLPGYSDKVDDLIPMASYLSQAGFKVHRFCPQPSDGSLGLEALAAQLADHIDDLYGPEGSYDLVGFSMGGLVCRYYVQRLGGVDQIGRLVTLATPHQGTWITYILGRQPGICQMRPASPFLQALNADVEMLARINFTSIWTPLDLTVLPAASSRLPVGRTSRLWLPHHRSLLTSRRSFVAVAEELMRPIPIRQGFSHRQPSDEL